MWKDITICGKTYNVLIEDGFVVRGTKIPYGQSQPVPAYVYRFDSKAGHGWWKENHGVSLEAFRSGVRRGTIDLK